MARDIFIFFEFLFDGSFALFNSHARPWLPAFKNRANFLVL